MKETDAYLLLAVKDSFASYGGTPSSVAVVAEFKTARIASIFAAWNPSAMQHGKIVSCVVPYAFIKWAHFFPALVRYELALPFAAPRLRRREAGSARAVAEDADESAAESASGSTSNTLLAVIDTGCPFAHKAFRSADGQSTAIRAIWDQDPVPDFGANGTSRGIPYGSVLSRDAMRHAIAAHPQHTMAGESACYRSVDYRELTGARSHGAMMLGLLRHGIPPHGHCDQPENDILFVQLPRQLLSVPSRAALARSILDGVGWVMQQRQKGETNVVVNVSYATSLTAHDASGLLAIGLQAHVAMAKKQGVELHIVFSAGNDFEESLHAELDGTRPSVRWRHASGNEVPCFAELWIGPKVEGGPWKGEVSIATPAGEALRINLAGQPSVVTSSDRTLALVHSHWYAGDGHRLLLFRLKPRAATGDYIITTPAATKSALYVSHRHGTVGYALRPSRSRLVNVAQQATVTGSGTLNGYACFPEAIAVGGYTKAGDQSTSTPPGGEVATKETSSAPARIPGVKDCLDYSALANQSAAISSVRGIGSFSACVVYMGGSSVAAPQAAKALGSRRTFAGVCAPRLGEIVR